MVMHLWATCLIPAVPRMSIVFRDNHRWKGEQVGYILEHTIHLKGMQRVGADSDLGVTSQTRRMDLKAQNL